MGGTKAGGLKARDTNLKSNPNFYSEMGKLGGSSGNTGGFYKRQELAKISGAKGGRKSRRGPIHPDSVFTACWKKHRGDSLAVSKELGYSYSATKQKYYKMRRNNIELMNAPLMSKHKKSWLKQLFGGLYG